MLVFIVASHQVSKVVSLLFWHPVFTPDSSQEAGGLQTISVLVHQSSLSG